MTTTEHEANQAPIYPLGGESGFDHIPHTPDLDGFLDDEIDKICRAYPDETRDLSEEGVLELYATMLGEQPEDSDELQPH